MTKKIILSYNKINFEFIISTYDGYYNLFVNRQSLDIRKLTKRKLKLAILYSLLKLDNPFGLNYTYMDEYIWNLKDYTTTKWDTSKMMTWTTTNKNIKWLYGEIR